MTYIYGKVHPKYINYNLLRSVDEVGRGGGGGQKTKSSVELKYTHESKQSRT